MQGARDWVGLARVGTSEKLREMGEEQKGEVMGGVDVLRWEGFWHPAVARRVVQGAVAGLNAAR